jgi:DNA polymerase
MSYPLEQLDAYEQLVRQRKQCRLCEGELVNPSRCCEGRFDSGEIGPWSRWQGGLGARLMVVGQDWGDVAKFTSQQGTTRPGNPTNDTLVQLIRAAGIEIDPPDPRVKSETAFFTNAVLCLKTEGGMQGDVEQPWFDRCGSAFLVPLIKLVHPRVVVTLGERGFRVLESLYALPRKTFAAAVEDRDGFALDAETRLFPRYHCGRRILNTHRSFEQQLTDWRRLAPLLADRTAGALTSNN